MFEASKFACTTVNYYRSIHDTQGTKNKNSTTSTMVPKIQNSKPDPTPDMIKKATPSPKSKSP